MRLILSILTLFWSAQSSALELDGRTEYATIAELNSSISSRITEILVVPGQIVSAGDLLLTLDSTVQQANLDHAQAQVNALIPALDRMQIEMDKAQELFDRDSLALVELEVADQNYAIAAARLAAAEADLAKARHMFSQTSLRSPIGGVVLNVDAVPGRFINTKTSDSILVTIGGLQAMSVEILLALEHWSPDLIGRPALVTISNQSYQGKITEVDHRITPAKNNHPAIRLRVEFPTNKILPAGLTATIDVDVE